MSLSSLATTYPQERDSHIVASDPAVSAARTAAAAIEDKKGLAVALLDVSDLLVVTEIFVIATGTSQRHVKTLVDDAEEALRLIDRKPLRREGKEHGSWVLLDYGDVVIHVFDDETRRFYDLERLWADAPRVDYPSQAALEA